MRLEKCSKRSSVNWTGRNESICAWIVGAKQTEESLAITLRSDPIDAVRDATVVEGSTNQLCVIGLDRPLRCIDCREHEEPRLID
jgi:hypothetical protein